MRQQRYTARTQLVLEAQEHVRMLNVRVQREISLMAFEMRDWGWTESLGPDAAYPVRVCGQSLTMKQGHTPC